MKPFVAVLALALTLAFAAQACDETKSPRPLSAEQLEDARHQLLYLGLARHAIRDQVRAKMGALPRGDLLSDELLPRAYADVPLKETDGPWLWPPSQLGEALSLFDPQPGRRALLVGAQEGWAALILNAIGVEVHVWEPSAERAARVKERLEDVEVEGFDASAIVWYGSAGEAIDAGPWDYLFVTGTMQEIPARWKRSLRPNSGMLIAPHGMPPAVTLSIYSWHAGTLIEREITRGNFPYLIANPTLNYASLYPPIEGVPVEAEEVIEAPPAEAEESTQESAAGEATPLEAPAPDAATEVPPAPESPGVPVEPEAPAEGAAQ